MSLYGDTSNGSYYYVVGFSEKHNRICSFRICRIVILEEKAVAPSAERTFAERNTRFVDSKMPILIIETEKIN